MSLFVLFLSLKICSLYFLLPNEDRLLSFSLLRSFARSTRPSSMKVDPSDIWVSSFFMILISFPIFLSNFHGSALCYTIPIIRGPPGSEYAAELQDYGRTGLCRNHENKCYIRCRRITNARSCSVNEQSSSHCLQLITDKI